MNLHKTLLKGAVTAVVYISLSASAYAVTFNQTYIFGDSYSDTGAGFVLTDGHTAASYFTELIGSELVLSSEENPGNRSINFAESGARVGVQADGGPTSLTNQVQHFADLVADGLAVFNPLSTMFFLSGGLNDHENAPASEVVGYYTDQISQLVSLGARYIQVALLPREIAAFSDSADLLNPAYAEMVPMLALEYPDVSIQLNHWGEYYDDIILNPDEFGFTNVTDNCLPFGDQDFEVCDNPEEYFFYWIVHPSDAAHKVVGARMYEDSLAISSVPLPAALPMLGAGLMLLGGIKRRKKKAAA